MSKWKEYKLGETLVSANTGLDAIKRAPIVSRDTGIKCLRIQDISQSKQYEDWGFTEVLDNNFIKFKLLANDIIVARTGATVGVNMIIKRNLNSVFNNGLIRLRVKNEFNSLYMYYLLRSSDYWSHINSIAFGTTSQPNIQINQLLSFKVKVPDFANQTLIAEILSSLDDKIELNNKINQELESLAQLLFKRWFVDYEFPNENGEPYKSSGGEMVDSELGEIPKGWSAEKLSQVTKLIRGISYRKPELVNEGEGTAFVNLKCFSLNGTFRQDGIKYYNGKYKEEQILSSNDILVAVTDLTQDREIIGMPILWNGYITALPSLDTCIIRSENLEVKNYLYYEFKTKRYKSRIIEFANGSTVLHLSVKGLETYILPLPNESLLKKWSETVQPILEKIQCNINQNNELSKTRDILLPKLISGELQLNDN